MNPQKLLRYIIDFIQTINCVTSPVPKFIASFPCGIHFAVMAIVKLSNCLFTFGQHLILFEQGSSRELRPQSRNVVSSVALRQRGYRTPMVQLILLFAGGPQTFVSLVNRFVSITSKLLPFEWLQNQYDSCINTILMHTLSCNYHIV